MPKYQNPNFDKKQYWLDRQASAADRRAQRLGKRYQTIVAIHEPHADGHVDWPKKQPSVKAIKKQTKRGRRVISYAS